MLNMRKTLLFLASFVMLAAMAVQAFALPSYWSLNIQVHNSLGNPVTADSITVTNSSGFVVGSTTNSQTLNLIFLTEDSYNISVYEPGYAPNVTTILLNHPIDIDIILHNNNPVSLQINGNTNQNVTVPYVTGTNVVGTSAGGSALLWRNGASVSNPDVAILPAGVYEYKVNASTDANYVANDTGLTYYLIIGKITPAVSLSVTTPITYGTPAGVTCTQTVGDTGATLNVLRNGVAVASGTTGSVTDSTVLAAGTYNYACEYVESQNYMALTSGSSTLTVNKATPTITLLLDGIDGNATAEFGNVLNATAVLSVSGMITTFIDGLAVRNAMSPSEADINTGMLTLGLHNITAVVNENENFTSASATHWATIQDTVAPVVTIISPTSTTYPSDSVDVQWSSSEPLNWIAYSIDGAANVTITGNVTISPGAGPHTITVYANDSVGHETGVTVNFAMNPADSIPPVINSIWNTTPVFAGLDATFNMNVTDNMLVWNVTVDGINAVNLGGNVWTATINVPAVDGLYRWDVVATDYAGNTAGDIISINVNTSADPNATLDTGKPRIGTIWPTSVLINEAVNLSANVSDDNLVTDCILFINGVNVTSMNDTLPSSMATVYATWTFSSAGTYLAHAGCHDSFGNWANGTAVNITVTEPSVAGGGGGGGGTTGFWPVQEQGVDITVQGPVIVDIGTTGVFVAQVVLTGRAADAQVSVAGAPYEITVSPSSTRINDGGAQAFTISMVVPADAQPGVFPLTVTATLGTGQTDSANIDLIIKAPGQAPGEVNNTTNQTTPSGLAGALIAVTSNPIADGIMILVAIGALAWAKYKKKWIFKAKTETVKSASQ